MSGFFKSTQVLTTNGFKDISQITLNDSIYQFVGMDKNIVVSNPVKIIKQEYNGLCDEIIQTKRKNIINNTFNCNIKHLLYKPIDTGVLLYKNGTFY